MSSEAKFQAAVKRVETAYEVLEDAKREANKIVSDYFVSCGDDVPEPGADVALTQDGDTLFVKSEAEELIVKAGAECSIIFLNKIGIVRVEAGDGSLVMFEGAVGGANVNQGHGSDVIFDEVPDSLDINQGAGSVVALAEDDN